MAATTAIPAAITEDRRTPVRNAEPAASRTASAADPAISRLTSIASVIEVPARRVTSSGSPGGSSKLVR